MIEKLRVVSLFQRIDLFSRYYFQYTAEGVIKNEHNLLDSNTNHFILRD